MPNRDSDDTRGPLTDDEEIVDIDEEEIDDDEIDDDGLDEESLSHAEFTAEVGSEGGSPGEAVELAPTRARAEEPRGSEATETWRPAESDDVTVDRRDPVDRGLVKDAP
jgi:hypothetical protein